MPVKLSTGFRVMRLRATVGALYRDAPPTLSIHKGTQPSTANDALPSSTLLGTVTAVSVPPDVQTFEVPLAFVEGAVLNSGTPSFARLKAGDGTIVADIPLSAETGDAPLKYNTSDFYEGGLLRVTSLLLRE